MKANYECKVRKDKQLIGVLTAMNSSARAAWGYFKVEANRLGGVVSDFKSINKR